MTVTRLTDMLADSARRHGVRPALTDQAGSLDYRALFSQLEHVAGGLAGLGLTRGARIAVYLPKQREAVVAMLGAALAGLVFVPVNPLLKAMQVTHILADSGAALLVTSRDRAAMLAEHWSALPDLTHIVLVDEAESLDRTAGPPCLGWAALMGAAPAAPAPVAPDDLAAILYTSGSTGRPKGVMLSHANLALGADAVTAYLGNRPDDCILAVLPLSFDYGLNQVLSGLHAGAHVVLHNYLFPADVARAVKRHGVTGLACVPPLWRQLADAPWPSEAAASLRYLTNSGGRMPRALLTTLRSLFPAARVYLMYGLTEAFRSTYLDPALVDIRPDSIGKAIPHAEILVLRQDGGVCDDDEPGELVHAGPLVAQGYWRDAERSAERFKPAPAAARSGGMAVWSGDTVRRDKDGFLYFIGRTDEMIKSLGNRISPTEVEEAALASGHAREAVALGVEDARLGQAIALVVTGNSDSAALESALKAVLPGFMVPQHILWHDSLPHNANGKLDRPRIVAAARQQLCAGEDQ